MWWVAGYLTAHNRNAPDTYNVLGAGSLPGVMLWLETYCRDNPQSQLAIGMDELTRELRAKRHRTIEEAGTALEPSR
jgi:hypothetical protein